ncbi:hypothetical protein WBP06_10240 [Novosphingobium sp. BL-8H]|uniref:hypothetical protein n=1 Tax=Novosphingobium sp. BL-8H TaxID=3127640 RepID=UPI0037567F7C
MLLKTVFLAMANTRSVAAIAAGGLVAMAPLSALAETPRDMLTTAAFKTDDKAKALQLIGQAIANADRALAARPGDREAALQRGVAIGYRGKLLHSRTDVKASLDVFQRLQAQNPRDPEVQMAIAAWHLGAVDELGGFLARTALGARKDQGLAAMTRAVDLGGNQAFYPGLAALLQIRSDHGSIAQSRKFAEAAATAQAASPLDAILKRAALAILPALRANDGKAAAALALKLLPFGRLTS